jgi:hypothetical protein
MAEIAGAKQTRRGPGRRFRPGESGNPAGKPKGTRNKATMAAEALLDGEVEALTRKAIEMAKQGDMTALRLCLDRILPPRRERPVQFRLPALRRAADAAGAMASIAEAVANGELAAGEAAELSKLVESFVKALEVTDFDKRLRLLEERDADMQED